MCGFDFDNMDDLSSGLDGINDSVDGMNDDYSFNPLEVDSSASESLKIGYNGNTDMLSFGSDCSDCSGSCSGNCSGSCKGDCGGGCSGVSHYDCVSA